MDFVGFRCQIVREATNTFVRHFVFYFVCYYRLDCVAHLFKNKDAVPRTNKLGQL